MKERPLAQRFLYKSLTILSAAAQFVVVTLLLSPDKRDQILATRWMSDLSQAFSVDDICRFWMDISGNHQGESVVRSTLTPFI